MLGLACVLWAGSSIAAKVALGSGSGPSEAKLGPFTLAAVRFGVAGMLLYLFIILRGEWRPVAPSDRRGFLLLGTFGIAMTYAVFYGGMRYTTATETTLLVAAEPVLIAAIARAVLNERLHVTQTAGLLAGFAGVYLIVVRGWMPRIEGSVLANGVVTGALVFEAYSSVVGKRLTSRYPGLMVACLGMLLGAAVLSPFAIAECVTRHAGAPGPREWLAVAYLTIVCSAVCYGIWYSLLRRYPVSSMAAFLFIQPLMGPVFGYIFLNEVLGLWSIAGAVLVMLGVWLVVRPRGPASDMGG